MAVTTPTKQDLHATDTKVTAREVRLLLVLWFLGGKEVNQSEVTKRVKLKEEKSADCQKIYTQLEKNDAIELAKKKATVVSITDKGISMLGQGLQSSDLAIEGTVVGAWMAKALLSWIQQSKATTNGAVTNGKVVSSIASYDEFKPEALKLFEKLDKGYNYSGLVPIWHMRRELGDRIGREEFSDWMMEMQAEQEFYLQTGASREATEDQKRDSITNDIRGLLFYASKPS